MIDENKIIILGSLSLRASKQSRTDTTNNDVLRACSLRASISKNTNTASNNVLNYTSAAIAGFSHNAGQWTDKKDMSYVIVDME